MSGNILQLAKRDSKHFVNNGGFQVEIELVTPTKDRVLSLTGFATKHWINFDTDGNPVNSKNVHICIDEAVLLANGYPYRAKNTEIFLKNHFVKFADSSGVTKNYVIRENFPNETLGLIVCILGDVKF